MVHQKLLSEGSNLTFAQLRRLEKMDAKKEREAKLLEIGKEGVVAAGQIGRGIMQGNVTGPVALFLILASEPALLSAAYANLAQAASIIGSAFRAGVSDAGLIPPSGGPPGGLFPSTPEEAAANLQWIEAWQPYINLISPAAGSLLNLLKSGHP